MTSTHHSKILPVNCLAAPKPTATGHMSKLFHYHHSISFLSYSTMIFHDIPSISPSYCWWRKSCTTLDVWNPINNGINHLSTGAGFLPSTVLPFNDRLLGPSPGGSAAEIRCVERCGCSLGPSVDVHGWDGWQIYLRLYFSLSFNGKHNHTIYIYI